jgi:phage-related protein
MRSFIYYEAPDGSIPVYDYLDALDKKTKMKILATIEKLLEVDQLRMPFFRPFRGMGHNLSELRIGKFRIFISEVEKNTYILLHIFRKKSDETPKRETDIAIKRLEFWKADHGN